MKSVGKIKYGRSTIEYDLNFKDRKSLGIKVHPDCSVQVIAPDNTFLEKIKEKVKSKAPWILRQQLEFLSFQPLTPKRKFVNGESHLYLGRQYKLKIKKGNNNEVRLLRGQLIIQISQNKQPKETLNVWYREKAEIHFQNLFEDAFKFFKKYELPTPEIQIRNMEKRWGSCTANGKIILNPELIKAPKGCISYVIVHELCHLIHHNHTMAFYRLQARMMPDWEKWKDRLEHILS